MIYSWPFNNSGSLKHGFFFHWTHSAALLHPQLLKSVGLESCDAEPRRFRTLRMWGLTIKLSTDVWLCRGLTPPNPQLFKGQLLDYSLACLLLFSIHCLCYFLPYFLFNVLWYYIQLYCSYFIFSSTFSGGTQIYLPVGSILKHEELQRNYFLDIQIRALSFEISVVSKERNPFIVL